MVRVAISVPMPHLCNPVDSSNRDELLQLFLGMGSRCDSHYGAERKVGCTECMEPIQLVRTSRQDRGLGKRE